MKTFFNRTSVLLAELIMLFFCTRAYAEIERPSFPFYIYSSFGEAKKTNFFPSGRMGDASAVRLWGNCREKPFSGSSCIKVIYSASLRSGATSGWAGVYWLYPANNWGRVPEIGFDLRGASALVFYARGEKGGEKITFKVGGVWDKHGDTMEATLPATTLTTAWTRYSIPLKGRNLDRIVGGFCWTATLKDNPKGAVFYLDEIYFE